MRLDNVTLELSAKAFADSSESCMRRTAELMFRQWKRLTDHAGQVSVLLWVADGSEILEYTGNPGDTFEWAGWWGCANPVPVSGEVTGRQRRDTHCFPRPYQADIAPRSYDWLRRLTAVLREVGAAVTGLPVRIGAPFDNGPEFAVSDFKYRRHPEIAQGHTIYPHSFVVCDARLAADPGHYAGFPDGIPGGTSVGTLLGRQFRAFSHDLGYDYLWLSNGMGFGRETWGIRGALFDKRRFYPERAGRAAAAMLDFWRDLTAACPGIVIETRGSNFSAGVEMATDAAPLRELYKSGMMAAPVNSPWAALNFNTGLELAAWMSHVAELPDDRFTFRYYIHDPWFLNSPWLDRYAREPWDIYLPLSVSRIAAGGATVTPNRLALLSVDDSRGELPWQVPDETIPHLLRALRVAPDAPGPLVWVYPFAEYAELTQGAARRPDVVLNEELFIGEALQEGLPLNTVISSGNLAALDPGRWDDTVLVIPVSAAAATASVWKRAKQVLFYGTLTLAPEELLEHLGLRRAVPWTGEVRMVSRLPGDVAERGWTAETLHVLEQFCAGGLDSSAVPGVPGAVVEAEAERGLDRRAAAVLRRFPSGAVAGFVAALPPCSPEPSESRDFDRLPPEQAFPAARLMRHLLGRFGWELRCEAPEASEMPPRCTISRHDNAFMIAVLALDTAVDLLVRTPFGAPLVMEHETRLTGGRARWRLPRSWHRECRFFVEQAADAVIGVKTAWAAYPEYRDRYDLRGLKEADLRIFLPDGAEKSFEAAASPEPITPGRFLRMELLPAEFEEHAAGRCAVLRRVSGFVQIAW